MSGYDANGNVATRNGYTLGWTSYNLPSSVAASGESSAFNYGPRHELWQQTYSGPSGSETTSYYGGLLEKVVNGGGTDYRHYVYANGELVAVYSRMSSGTNTLRFVLNDHEQSPAVIVNSSGASVVSESFAAFGARRNPFTWSGAPSPGDLSTIASISRVGYTGQTMIGETGLIHMRGRVQDAVTGRFLSADPGGIDPALTQTFDRYSYVINNPITLVDPSGYELCADIYFPPVGKQPDTAGSDAIVIGHTSPLRICIHGLGDSSDRNSNKGNRDNTKQDQKQQQAGRCGNVPALPPGQSVDNNIATAQAEAQQAAAQTFSKGPMMVPVLPYTSLRLEWFKAQVQNKGPWDYKQQGGQYQAGGNFNFGATGAALGLPDQVLLRGAGWAQQIAGTSDPSFINPAYLL